MNETNIAELRVKRRQREEIEQRPFAYLAGPDVFHRDALLIGERKKALCEDYDILGLYPLDQNLADDSRVIYAACNAMMAVSDIGIFNLTPFRGPSADAGTVMELGLMVASGKPVFAYTNVSEDLMARLRRDGEIARDETTGVWRDAAGMMVENFGNADNLMLDEALVAQGRKIHRHAAAPDRLFDDLTAFAACLAEARAWAAVNPRRRGS